MLFFSPSTETKVCSHVVYVSIFQLQYFCSWCWLKGPQQIPTKSWIYFIPYTYISIRFPYLCQGYNNDHCVVTPHDGGMGRLEGGRGVWFIYVRVWLGGQGMGIIAFLIFAFFVCAAANFLSWLIHDSCCVCFIGSFMLPLSLVPLIMCY